MIKAVLFDFDGVLTTDATGSETTCKYLSEQTGIDYAVLLKAYRHFNKDLLYGRATHSQIWRELCNQLNKRIDIALLYKSFINTPIDDKMIDLVQVFKFKDLKTGMITDNKTDRIDAIVSHMNWHNLFDVITVSANVGSGKDNRDIFEKTIEKLDLHYNECVFIDNNKNNLIVPKDLGMSAIYFNDEVRDIAGLITELREIGVSM